MKDFFCGSVYFCVFLTVGSYLLGDWMKKKFHFKILNGMLIAIVISIGTVLLLKIDLPTYQANTKVLNFFLTPATVCLGIPLYEQFEKLRSNWKAILGGIISGVLANMVTVLGMCLVFGVGHREYVSILPKSITTAMGLALSEELGGLVPITMAVIIIAGNLGNIFAEILCKLFRITEPVAKGVAIGTSSHMLGTAKAMEIGDVEGAMSSLSIAVCGLITVVAASIFAQFI
ncbi:MAG: LrgB family protein [Treponema sp.]|jgi:putative effector of murein hydrolase|nr:LrgB family protein [Treponema sp.]MBQ2081675.1 LrgB family protein [Treponema sp.]MBR6295354.1 LrgB family protein [Treponema sp.]